MSSSAAEARGVYASTIVDGTPSLVGQQATTSLVVRMPVAVGPGGAGRKDDVDP